MGYYDFTKPSLTAPETTQAVDYNTSLNGSFVPYVGATGNVNLNNKNFTTVNGTINGGTVRLGTSNSIIGFEADKGKENVGGYNTYFGYQVAGAGNANPSQLEVTAVGYQSSYSMLGGAKDVAIGAYSLYSASESDNCVAIGDYSLYAATGGTSSDNTAVGASSLANLINGANNTCIGSVCLGLSQFGERNVGIGYGAGLYELGSDSFYVNNADRGSLQGDRNSSLIYGTFNSIPEKQQITFNVGIVNTTGNITANSFQSTGWNSQFGTATQYFKIEKLNLGAFGNYPMLSGYSDGAIGNIGAIKDNMIVYDGSNTGTTRLLFSADDLSNVADMQFIDSSSTFYLTKYAGSTPLNFIVNGSVAGKNATFNYLSVGENSVLLPRPQELMVYGSANITNILYSNRSIFANENVSATWFNGNWNGSTNYIPYVGATNDIDLNLRNFTGNGSYKFGYTPQFNWTLRVFPELGTATLRGRVGILNDNPQTTLHVGNAGSAGAVYIGVDSASNRASGFRLYNAGTQIWALFKNNDNLNTMGLANQSNDILYTITQGGRFIFGNFTNRLQYDFNGYVNVTGNSTMNGNLNVTSNLNVNGNSTITITHSGMFTSSENGVAGTTLGINYAAVNFTNSVHEGDGFKFNGTALQLIDPQQSGEYQVQWHTQKDGIQNHIYFGKIFVNEVEQNSTMDRGVGQASNALRLQGIGYVNISYGDNVTLRMKDISVGGSTPTVYIKNVNLWRAGRLH